MKRNKRKRPFRRVVAVLLLAALALMLYHIVGGYLPFRNRPALTDTAEIEVLADEMQRDADTRDRALLISDSDRALDERLRLIHQARREVVIASYDLRDGESTRDMLSVALERADAGVNVQLLVDGIAALARLSPSPLFGALEDHPSIEMRFYNPPRLFAPWHDLGRMHDKYIIVDDVAYILGGRNTFDAFIGDYPVELRKDDREALVYNGAQGTPESGSSSLSALKDYFEDMWSLPETSVYAPAAPKPGELEADLTQLEARFQRIRAEKPELFAEADYESMTLPTAGIWLVSNPITIYAKQPVVFAQLCALMARAKEDVVIHSPYAVLNDDMRDALSAIAAKAPVTLMINAVENGANVVGSSDYLYHKQDVLSTGVEILEYAGGISYHGKSVAIDGDLSVIGSYNLDLRSTYVDTELMLVIRGEAVDARLREHMEALHADCLRVIDAEHSEHRPGLTVDPLSMGRRIALRVLGALLQPFRNLV